MTCYRGLSEKVEYRERMGKRFGLCVVVSWVFCEEREVCLCECEALEIDSAVLR